MADLMKRIKGISLKSRHRKDMGDIKGLMDSIAEVGLLHPIVVTPDSQLIAGQRRLKACKNLKWKTIPVHIVDLKEIVRGEFAENFVRKDFLPSEAVAISEVLEPEEKKGARERQAHGGPRSGKLPERSKGDVRDKVARYAGMSGSSLERAKQVVGAAKKNPSKYSKLVVKMDATGKVNGAFKEMRKIEEVDLVKKEVPPQPKGPFRVIVADPPWPYGIRQGDITHRARNPYGAMSMGDIKKYLKPDLPFKDCVLWLWTTNAFLRESFEVIEAWGFQYKTMLTWVKNKIGLGDYLRGKTEHCMMCVKGKPLIHLTNQSTALIAPSNSHSQKPKEFYSLVDALCPGSKVELFSRVKKRDGWVLHGINFD